MRAQLESLAAADRELLEAASVVGKEFSSPVVAALAGGDALEAEERLLRLSRVQRVIECLGDEELPDGTFGTRYRFAHGLFRRVLYEDLVAPRRAQLHRRTAELLTRHWGEDAPMLAVRVAEHFELGRDVASAARFRTRAGDHAARRFAAAEAEEQYTCALRLLEKVLPAERGPQEIGLLRRRAMARHAQARFDDAVRDYEAMLERARAARSLAAECDALSGLSNALFFAQRLPEIGARAREGLAAAEREGSPHRLSEAHARVAQALVVEGRLDEAAPRPGRRDRVRPRERRRVGAATGLWLPRLRSLLAAASTRPPRSSSTEGAAHRRGARGRLRGPRREDVRGPRPRQPRPPLRRPSPTSGRPSPWPSATATRFWRPRLVSHLGWVHRELQAPERAREFDARALEIARENPSPWTPEADALINLCVDDVRSGHPDRAAELLARLEAGARQGSWMRWLNELRLEAAAAEHWAARGDFDVAAARAARLLEIARSLGARTYCCAAERVRLEARPPRRGRRRGGGPALGGDARRVRDVPRPARGLEVGPRPRARVGEPRQRAGGPARLRHRGTGRADHRRGHARRGAAERLPRLAAVRDVLDRAGFGAGRRLKGHPTGPRPPPSSRRMAGR